MNKIHAVIFLCGLPIDTPKAIKNFECNSHKELIEELKTLQQGYCEKGDKISVLPIRDKVIHDKNRTVVAVVSNDCDWHYEALYPLKLKETAFTKA